VLSRREQEILALLAEGYRNKEIGSILSVSENTIRAHVASLYRKIQVTGRVEAALYYFGKGSKNGRPRPPMPSMLTSLTAPAGDSATSAHPPTCSELSVAAQSR
jgi:DNA-binding CsgD family transcriptional regulator